MACLGATTRPTVASFRSFLNVCAPVCHDPTSACHGHNTQHLHTHVASGECPTFELAVLHTSHVRAMSGGSFRKWHRAACAAVGAVGACAAVAHVRQRKKRLIAQPCSGSAWLLQGSASVWCEGGNTHDADTVESDTTAPGSRRYERLPTELPRWAG